MDILNSQVTYGDSQVTPVLMGGSCVVHGSARTPRFLEANVKSLIFTIGARAPLDL